MIEGLAEVGLSLERRGIRMVLRHVSPEIGVTAVAGRASLVVVDRGYLKIQRQWRRSVAGRIDCPFLQVESDVVVPVEVASQKEEYSTATFRPKVQQQMGAYMLPLKRRTPLYIALQIMKTGNSGKAAITVMNSKMPKHTIRTGTRARTR